MAVRTRFFSYVFVWTQKTKFFKPFSIFSTKKTMRGSTIIDLSIKVPKEKHTILMNLSLILFLIGILGFILNRKNIILMIISIEIMLLAVTLLVLVSSYAFDDIRGQTYSIYIIAIAGAESAIGLGILVAYYRLRGNISARSAGSRT